MNQIIKQIIAIFVFSTLSGFAFPAGNGTMGSPYEIWNLDNLLELNDSLSVPNWSVNKYFILINDIATLTTPIGYYNST
jgi:hypothetical protein